MTVVYRVTYRAGKYRGHVHVVCGSDANQDEIAELAKARVKQQIGFILGDNNVEIIRCVWIVATGKNSTVADSCFRRD